MKIGKENNNSMMKDCSLITATYSIGEETVGTIAILGPTRMEYSRVISLLDFLSKDLSVALTKTISINRLIIKGGHERIL